MKILYVENHPVFAKTVSTQFLTAHEVLIVPTMGEATQALRQNSYNVVLVDYDLDDGKGAELIREIRQGNPTLRIIGVSAHAAGNDALLQAGADAICSKIEFDKIGDVIRKLGL